MIPVIALFETTRAVLKCERLCKAAGIQCKVIPVPRDLSAGCGMAIELNETDAERVENLLQDEVIEVRLVRRDH
jgi:hypothetical protein